MSQDYYDIAKSIGETIAKCSKALTEDQQTVLAGALAVYLYKAESELSALKQELQALREQEPSAWIYPSDVEKFKTNETFATVFSVKVGCPDEESVQLYTAPMPAREGWKLVIDEEKKNADR